MQTLKPVQTQMPIHSQKRPLRRTAALLCAVLAGLGLAAGRAAAQTGPLTTSPPFPVPYQWQNYHSGGADTPYPSTVTEAPFLTPLINPIQGQLQGTPTELYSGNLTQIPSYLLGNYDPTQPPAGLQGNAPGSANVYYPNHFADGDIFSWAAPFSYLPQTGGTVSVDDSSAAPTGGAIPTSSGFTSTGFTTVTLPGAGGADTSPAAGTATNSEYLRLASGTNGSATWTLFQPTAGNYSLYFHIPNDLPDTAGVIEPRDTEVLFAISVRDAAGNVTSNSTSVVSQTEANDSQFLAGPLQVASGGSVVVTLTRSTTAPKINDNADYLVADSMTLQQTTGDVESAPTVINTSLYPTDFTSTTHPLQYWGIFIPPGLPAGATQSVGTTAVSNANPDTTGAASPPTAASVNSGNVVLKTGTQTDPTRRIRQLVYFGRSDPSATITTSSADDSQPAEFTGAAGSTSVPSATATNGEYLSYPATNGSAPTTLVATWNIPSPASSGGNNSFVYAHIPATPGGETRQSTVFYTVQVNGGTPITVQISQVTAGAAAQVLLPTGPLAPAAGSTIVVKLYSENGVPLVPAPPPPTGVVVADSITVSTPTGQGAVYCVDGFTGGVVWRFETPGSANGPSAPVFGSPTIAKINVLVTPAVGGSPAVYANRLVVIVADNNGLVYCLDAIGNGDGTSNSNALAKDANGNPIAGEPVTIPQPAYGGVYGAVATPLVSGVPAAPAALTAHVGTTGVYWIYRPDASRPKFLTGAQKGFVKPIDPTADLPVPAAFNTASPAVFVDPTVNATAPTASNSKVYVGNSNGVLYALDGAGAGIDTTSAASLAASGDTFNYSQDLQGGAVPQIPSAQPLWWFNLRGPNPNSGSTTSNADFESAPAIYVGTSVSAGVTSYLPTVYVGSAHEQEATSNVGRLYALDGLYGPSFDNGRLSPVTGAANYSAVGSFNYNVGQRPQTSKTDTTHWSFPDAVGTDAYSTGQSYNSHLGAAAGPRPALGNITGSPVVFTNIHETATPAQQTRIYFAADSGFESTTATPTPAARPDQSLTGRLWAVNLDGSVGTTTNNTTNTPPATAASKVKNNFVWAYPLANDPNDAFLDSSPEPYAPIGSFLRATPAIGFVQFPKTIVNGDAGATAYNPVDAVATTGIDGLSVPMLYVGTQGVNDTALYAVDIDGGMTLPNTAPANDQRTIYRVVSPDGSIYQSSPALVANATTKGGNGGSVYAVAGNTLYDYSATPISNPFYTSAQLQPYPLIRENRAFTGFGPISSPAIAGADVSDITSAAFTTYNVGAVIHNTTDWVYVGDSTSGFCRGITPNDPSYGGIPLDLGTILPPTPNSPTPILLNALIQTFLVSKTAPAPQQGSKKSTEAAPFGVNAPLPVYEWGESAYARFTNVAPPNPTVDPHLFVHDTIAYSATAHPPANASSADPIPFYTSDGSPAQTVTFNLADTETGLKFVDSGSVQPTLVTTPPDGFVADAAATAPASFPSVVTNLVANDGNRYLGTYTYTIADGSARNNTPGARRHFQNVRQTVTEYDFVNTDNNGDLLDANNYVKKGTAVIGGDAATENIASIYDPVTKTYSFSKVAAVDQPTFGVLNPLAARGGGVSQIPADGPKAFQIGDEAGPFRGVADPLPISTTPAGASNIDFLALQALSNGNEILHYAPPSSSGVTGNPIQLATGANDPTAVNTPTSTAVIVTATGLIAHNSTGSNAEQSPSGASTGMYASDTTDGLMTPDFGGYGLDVFDRSALNQLGQILRLKMTVPTSTLFAPPSGRDGLYWNSNSPNDLGSLVPPTHDAVVNFLPWETAPTPYSLGGNSSLDYPNIAPGNITQVAIPINSSTGGDLTSNFVTLPPATGTSVAARTVYGDPVNIQVSVPHYQPPNLQLYQQNKMATGQSYSVSGEIEPVTTNPMSGAITSPSNIAATNVFPMGYVTSKRLFVPNASGFYSYQRPYRDVRVYTGVKVDMRTSIVNPTTDIGKVPAAFGVQTEDDPTANSNLFSPYNPAFQAYFKPLEVHNDGNVNLLNVHFDQQYAGTGFTGTLPLYSDTVDPLSGIPGFDLRSPGATPSLYGITGPRDGLFGTGGAAVPEQRYLIRSSLDSDLVKTYDRNPTLPANYYPGATFHKPTAGGNQPSTLSIPDSPETFDPNFTVAPSPTGLPTVGASAPPFVSIAMPFGTPVGTYATSAPQSLTSLRLFEGIDTAVKYPNGIPAYLYPPIYGTQVGGIGTPVVDAGASNTGQPLDSSGAVADIYNGLQPLSTTGTQLTGTVIEQRLTDGYTYGAVPMIDASPQGTAKTGTPDFAPAAFRDLTSGDLSVYWTTGRTGVFGISAANLPYMFDPTPNSNANPNPNPNGHGYFMPTSRAGQWWQPFSLTLPTGTHSGLSITHDQTSANFSAFDVAVSTAPYSNTLYYYPVTAATGALGAGINITPITGPNSNTSQVKYGVKGVYMPNYTDPLWAFWTASTRGRTSLYYNSQGPAGGWLETINLLPVPAGLTSVADASPMLMPLAPDTPQTPGQIEVTYSGTSPDGKTNLYVSRYQPDMTTASQLDLVAFPAVTENLTASGAWYQARDVAWSRTGALNLFVNGQALLYNTSTNAPLFTKAIYDKASGLLVLTGVKVPNGPASTTNTVYVDAATGRIRFSPPLLTATQNFTQIRALFSPTARRLTTGTDSRANTGPVTFLDQAPKLNDAPGAASTKADRRWTIWRKASAANDTASSTLYFKTQRLTFFLPSAVAVNAGGVPQISSITLNGTAYSGPVDVDYERGRLYFPIASGAEGEQAVVAYTNSGGTSVTTPADVQNTVQWQDEVIANNNDVIIPDSAAGLNNVTAYAVPIDTAINENNVAAFLDPFAGQIGTNGLMNPHKVWLFWNSTRNGTADIYSETIDPRFAPGP